MLKLGKDERTNINSLFPVRVGAHWGCIGHALSS